MKPAVAFLLGLLAGVHTSVAAEIRYHGFDLDDKHRVMLEEEDGVVRICLWTRGRELEGPLTQRAETETSPDFARFTKRECLAQIKSEVVTPARPNPFNNPGAVYRVTIEAVELNTKFANTFEVGAADARGVLFSEFRKLQSVAEGIHRDVLYYGAGLTATVLSAADRFPADLPDVAVRTLNPYAIEE